MNNRIALVGGCGFIGHNLAISLKESGFEPIIIDSLSINNLYSLTELKEDNQNLYQTILNSRINILKKKNIKLLIQDSRDYHSMSKILSDIKPIKLIHLAAVSHANKSNKDPHSTFDNSLRTLENSLDFCKSNNTHIIYFSSSMVYGNFKTKSVNEETVCNPLGIYGNLKYSGELMVKSYNQVFELPYTIIRPSALYGERCVSRRVGQIFIENSLLGKELFIDGDGEECLDFTYIKDFVDGVVLCCKKKEAINQTFNLTYGESRPINDLIKLIKKNFNNIEVIYKERDKLNPIRGTLEIAKAKKLIGYVPKYSIDVGYQNYIDWYKDFWSQNFGNL